MPFTNQRERLQRTLQNALAGATYDSSHEEDGRMFIVTARRPDGRRVSIRFRGVSESAWSTLAEQGSPVRLRSVSMGGGFSLLGLIAPRMRPPPVGYARVRIEAGAARLDIVCQDAEWWEGDAPD